MTLLTTSAASGHGFAPTQAADFFFQHLTAQSVGLTSGFRTVRTGAARLDVPMVVSDASVNWTAEGQEITPSDVGTDTVQAVPRKLSALTYASNEMVSDSNPDAQDMLAANLARAAALKLDLGFYEGSGTPPEILGLKNQSGIQTVSMGTDGGSFANLDPFADSLGMLAQADAQGSAIVMHPRSWRALIQVKEDSTDSNKPLLQQSAGSGAAAVEGAVPTRMIVGTIYGVPVWLSSQLATDETQGTSTNASSAYVYEAPQVVAVMRQDAAVDVDTSAAFSSDRTAVRVTMRADLVLPNPAAVVRIRGIIP